jgi:phosphoribosylformylglycinamidine synthase
VPARARARRSDGYALDLAFGERARSWCYPFAHNEGNYFVDERTLRELEDEGRVVLRYLENPNGSANGIAGICSRTATSSG